MPLSTVPVLSPGALAGLVQPELRAEELVLRPWAPTDVATVHAAYADPDIERWHARAMTPTEAAAWVASWPGRWRAESGAGWAVTRDGAVVGQLSLRRIDLGEGLAEISYWVLPAARGAGVAPRALGALCAWAFGELGLHRLEVAHSTANAGSCRVAERAGFPLEGTKRRQALHADGWHDMHLHARLEDDPPVSPGRPPTSAR